MEQPIRIVVPRNRVQSYSPQEWKNKRSLISRLYLDESRTVDEIVRILAEQHNFYVNKGMLTYRLGIWHRRKNCTKTVVKDHFRSSTHTDSIRIRNNNDMARLMNAAKRHGIEAFSGQVEAFDTVDRPIQLPDVDYQREAMLTSASHYVGGAFDGGIWDAKNAPVTIVNQYLNWAYGLTPSSFRLLGQLMSARMCYRLGEEGWAGILLRAGFAELDICLRDQPYQALPIILILLGLLREQQPDARTQLLNQCLGLTEIYRRDNPIRRILEQVSVMDRGNYDDKFCNAMFAQTIFCFVDELRIRLGEIGDFACSLLRDMNEFLVGPGSEENGYVRHWVDPVTRRNEDPEFFDSNQNVEECIVQAVECHGYPELLRVRMALEEQRNAAQSDQVRQMLAQHLQSLDVPIHRIGYRDCFRYDRNGFVEHWRSLTENRNSPQDARDPQYLQDMLIAWKLFTAWGDIEEAQRVGARIGEIFIILHAELT